MTGRPDAWRRGLLALCTLLAPAGCDDPARPDGPAAPEIEAAAVEPNPLSALSTVVRVRARHADSARVLYWADDEPVAATPFVPLEGDSARLVTLGLLAATPYRHQVEALGGAGVARSDTLALATGVLPERLARLEIRTEGAATHPYTLVSGVGMGGPALVYAFDSAGRVRWYREFTEDADPSARAQEAKQQPNGNVTVFIGASIGFERTEGRYVEIRPSGEVVREIHAGAGLFTDSHELLLTFDAAGAVDAFHLFGYDHRTTDLTAIGGRAAVDLAGHTVLRVAPDGTRAFAWTAWDHLAIADWIEPPEDARRLDRIDFDHPNSLDIDGDGNYVVSFRHLGEVVKIDARTGAILWRFGGRNNQFRIVGDPLGFFSAQHTARVLENGNLLLFDNGARHEPPTSRAVEYRLDLATMTATLVWEHRADPARFAAFASGAERHRGGNTLIGFAPLGHVVEVRPDGSVAWSADLRYEGSPAVFYRAHALPSLYRHERP